MQRVQLHQCRSAADLAWQPLHVLALEQSQPRVLPANQVRDPLQRNAHVRLCHSGAVLLRLARGIKAQPQTHMFAPVLLTMQQSPLRLCLDQIVARQFRFRLCQQVVHSLTS